MADNNFERLVEQANTYYESRHIAKITKVNPPVVRRGSFLVYGRKSTVDYVGVYKGRFIAFDCKACKLDYFPMKNIIPHQVDYMRDVLFDYGGITFFLIHMEKYKRFWLLPPTNAWFSNFWSKERKPSMQIEDLSLYGHEIKERKAILDYIPYVDTIRKILAGGNV